LETGSLISIKKNVKDILIPSEEMKIQVHPMDYEEFCGAVGYNYSLLQRIYETGRAIGQATNRKLMRDFRLYMAVGGMPQAVEAPHQRETEDKVAAESHAPEVRSPTFRAFGDFQRRRHSKSFLRTGSEIYRERNPME